MLHSFVYCRTKPIDGPIPRRRGPDHRNLGQWLSMHNHRNHVYIYIYIWYLCIYIYISLLHQHELLAVTCFRTPMKHHQNQVMPFSTVVTPLKVCFRVQVFTWRKDPWQVWWPSTSFNTSMTKKLFQEVEQQVIAHLWSNGNQQADFTKLYKRTW